MKSSGQGSYSSLVLQFFSPVGPSKASKAVAEDMLIQIAAMQGPVQAAEWNFWIKLPREKIICGVSRILN